MFDFWSSLSSVRKRLVDTFSSRSNTSASLGIATDGSKWTAINGIIQVISGKAKATTTPIEGSSGSNYPIAVVSMPTANNSIAIKDTNQGSAAALWVQSSSDWWMVNIESTFNTIPGNSVYGPVGSNYAAVGTNYGVVGSNYGAVGTNYSAVGSNYSATGSNYGATGSNYGGVGSNYAAVGTNYGTTVEAYVSGTNYSSYSAWSIANYTQNYKSVYNSKTTYSVATYGATGTTYSVYAPTNPLNRSYKAITKYAAKTWNSSTNYTLSYATSTQTANYSKGTYAPATGSNYAWKFVANAPVGSNYGPVGVNYGPIGSNYGAIGTTYGATGSNYGPVGTNYGTVASNYGSVGSNYGATGTNYGVTSSNATTYAYAQYLKIRQSSSSVVSTITSALISTTQTIASILVQVSGNTITAKAYSDNNLTTQIGSDLVHTATGVTVTTQFGIGISPSAYNQSDIIGSSVNISRI